MDLNYTLVMNSVMSWPNVETLCRHPSYFLLRICLKVSSDGSRIVFDRRQGYSITDLRVKDSGYYHCRSSSPHDSLLFTAEVTAQTGKFSCRQLKE